MRFLKMAAVCAVVALGVGAASATASSLITSSQIKNGTIKMADISPSAKRALKGSRGPQGVPGFNGAQGVPGTAGPAGGFDPAKVHYVQGATVTLAPGEAGSATVNCPAGAKALSGGWTVIAGDVGEVFGSRSYDSGGSWSVLVFNHAQYTNADVTPFAVCASR